MCRVLLDDVLAAVDSHVARHVFGVLFAGRLDYKNHLALGFLQTTSSVLKVFLPPKPEFSLRMALPILDILTRSHTCVVESSLSADHTESLCRPPMAQFVISCK